MPALSRKDILSWRGAAVAICVILFAPLTWAAVAPLQAETREEVFEIPPGTSERRIAGEEVDILPQNIQLTLGLNDVLVLKNSDSAPHIFGPTLIMPGQSFSLPFSRASTYTFVCTAHADGTLNVIVNPNPAPGLERLRWRWRSWTNAA